MILYTAQYRYAGPDRFDITVRGQDPMGLHFAPTWNMVMDHKQRIITDQQYIDKYYAILERVPQYVWDWFFDANVRTLVCFCRPEAFCHRNILVNYVSHMGVQCGGFKETIC